VNSNVPVDRNVIAWIRISPNLLTDSRFGGECHFFPINQLNHELVGALEAYVTHPSKVGGSALKLLLVPIELTKFDGPNEPALVVKKQNRLTKCHVHWNKVHSVVPNYHRLAVI